MENEKTPLTMPLIGGLLAGASVMFGLPLVLATTAVEDGFVEILQMGGAAQYLILLVAGIVAAGSIGGIVLAARVKPALAAVLPVGPLLVFGLGTIGFLNGMQGALAAVAHVAPADKALITFAAMSEATCCILLGGSLGAAQWLGLGFGLFLAAFGPKQPASRAPLRVTAVACLGLGVWAVIDVMRAGFLGLAFRAASRIDVKHVDRYIVDLGGGVVSWTKAGLMVAAGALVLTLLAAAWGALRAKAPGAVGFSVAGAALCALCIAGVLGAQRRQADDLVERFAAREVGAPPLEFNGEPTKAFADVTVDRAGSRFRDGMDLKELAERSRGLHGEAGPMLGVVLTKETDTGALVTLMADARHAGFSGVELLGRAPKAPAPELPPVLKMIYDNAPRDVATSLLLANEDKNLRLARITKSGVELDGATLPFAEAGQVDPEPDRDVLVQLGPEPVELVVRALVTLRHSGYRPQVLIVP